MTVEWRECVGFPDYAVSNFSDVKRVVTARYKNYKPGNQLKPNVTKDGYHRFTLYNEGERTRKCAHQLVCEAWHGPKPSELHIVCHDNDIKSENTPDNVYWGTPKRNGEDSVRNGRSVRGENVNTSKLTESQVIGIRERAFNGESNIALAKEFGIPDSAISLLVRGVNWKHAGGPIMTRSRRGYNPYKAPVLTNPNSKTGLKGVRLTQTGKYQVDIKINGGKQIRLGTFPTVEEAASAYAKAANENHHSSLEAS